MGLQVVFQCLPYTESLAMAVMPIIIAQGDPDSF